MKNHKRRNVLLVLEKRNEWCVLSSVSEHVEQKPRLAAETTTREVH